MLPSPTTIDVPLRVDQDGRIRVGKTRVLLDVVIYSFLEGNAPETIVDQYSALSLDDVYVAIAYYLKHRQEIDAYLREQEAEDAAFRREYEAKHPPTLTREILLARLEAKRKQSQSGE